MVNRRAQIKFGETFGIIIIVYILLMVGLIWYNNVNTKSLNEIKEQNRRDSAYDIYYFIVNADFLHISQQGDVDEEFDLIALETMYNYSKGPGEEYLRTQLKNSLITMDIYSSIGNNLTYEKTILLYNKTPNSQTNQINNIETFTTFVPVVDPTNTKTNVGFLQVKVYN